jgi:hypothetical protein
MPVSLICVCFILVVCVCLIFATGYVSFSVGVNCSLLNAGASAVHKHSNVDLNPIRLLMVALSSYDAVVSTSTSRKALSLLMERGNASPLQLDSEHNSALHFAVSLGSPLMVKFFAELSSPSLLSVQNR